MYAFLILLHFALKDYIFPFNVLFYATPLILIILFGVFTTIIFSKNKKVFYSLTIVLGLLIFNWFSNYYNLPKTRTNNAKDSAVLFWNIAKNTKGFPLNIISKKVEESPVNILTFVETDSISNTEFETLKKELKMYSFKKLKGNMIIGIKGEIKSVIYQTKEKSYKYNNVTAVVNNNIIKILIADVYANPFNNKTKALKTIINYSEENKIDFIIGDFNTPYESIHFNTYKKNFTSFREYSEGFTATWPFGIPLLELDQIWFSNTIYGLKLNKYNYNFSDHQLLIAEYILKN